MRKNMREKRRKKGSVGAVAGRVAVIVTAACCIYVLLFLTKGVMEKDADSENAVTRFDRAALSAIVERARDRGDEGALPADEQPEPEPVSEPEPVPEPEPEPDNRTISFFGDSITTYSQYNSNFYTAYPYGDVDDVSKTWWMQVADRGGYTYLSNSSSSGSCVVKNGDFSGQSEERIDFLDAASGTVVVFMGMNDYTGLKELDEFEKSYVTMLGNIKKRCAGADIVCCTIYPVSEFEAQKPVSGYNDIIKRIAADNGCKVADLAVLEMNQAAGTTEDIVHPTYSGMTAIADLVLGVLQGKNGQPEAEKQPEESKQPEAAQQP